MNHSKYKKQHLLQKLYNREIYGHFVRGVPLNYEPAKQLFNSIPRRLIFRLADTIPNLENHILMGVTRCGQLLLTYTYNGDTSSDYSPNMVYRYRLHFWEFTPGRPAAKVAEVQLFDSCTVTETLTIGICQWANNNDKLLVYGFCHGPDNTDGWGTECEYRSTTYITVTTVPTLNGCRDCMSVAASFDEEEMAANWDSCVGLTCLRHGLTLHTHFSVPHVNTFDPHTCMASDSEILVNTGAFLHVISLRLEQTSPKPKPHQSQENIISQPIVNRMSYSFLRSEGYSIFLSENWPSRMTNLLIEKIKKGCKYEMADLPLCLKLALERHLQINNPACGLLKDVKSEIVNSDLNRPKQKWFTSDKASRISHTSRKRQCKRPDEPDKVYDFKETEESQCEPKFKLFRRRCLADKMYEFRGDEEQNVENIRPQETRDKERRRIGAKVGKEETAVKTDIAECLKSPERTKSIDNSIGAIIADWDSDTESVVGGYLTGLEAHCQALKPHNAPGRHVYPGKPQPFILTDEMREEINSGFGHQPVSGCSVKFTRRYLEIDQEITSTITDIEDDEIGSGFHCALPLSVHGSAYAQMEMISNQKAEKLSQQGVNCAIVDQSSLDIEQFCFKAAEAICKMEGYKFWFCSDYDTDIVWMCPYTSDVVGVLFIRMNAEECNSDSNSSNKDHVEVREFYEASCLYVWSPHSGEVHLEGYRWGGWGPATRVASQLRRAFQPPSSVRAVIHRVDEGIPVLPLNLILDHENLIGFRRLP